MRTRDLSLRRRACSLRPTIVAMLILVLLLVLSGSAQDIGRLEDKRISISKKDVAFGTVAGYLCNQYGVLFGVEPIPGEEERSDLQFSVSNPGSELFRGKKTVFSFDLHDATLVDVMNSLIKQKQGYQWEISDGVVNIFPTQGRDKRLQKLLDVKIKSFSMVNQGDLVVGKILNFVVGLPELKEFEKANDVVIPNTRTAGFDSIFEKIDSVQLKDLTFKQLLNKLSQVKGSGGWRLSVVKYPDREKDVISIEI